MPAQTPIFIDAFGIRKPSADQGSGQQVLAAFIPGTRDTAYPTASSRNVLGRCLNFPAENPQTKPNSWNTDNSDLSRNGALGLPRADRHNEGANYAFADGHAKWHRSLDKTVKAGQPIANSARIDLDYNGDGVVGTGEYTH